MMLHLMINSHILYSKLRLFLLAGVYYILEPPTIFKGANVLFVLRLQFVAGLFHRRLFGAVYETNKALPYGLTTTTCF